MLRSIRKDLVKIRAMLDIAHAATEEPLQAVDELIEEIDRELQEGYYPEEDE